jgi:alkanesulfonate monooxygenase SsuD/methylene tetrahydromethanopterin reductase-like flavin-dependent oxidoreductase (luciferase family)
MSRPRIGTVFLPDWSPELLRDVTAAAEASGLDDLWFWEDCFNEAGPSMAATALAWTERIAVGIGLMPVPLRNVATTAMEVATLQRLFPGRFVPVVGHGVQDWMEQLGVRAASPLTLLREYADALRRLLAGEKVTVQGEYVRLDRVQLRWPPAPPERLLVGGEGPKTLALAARSGTGTMLTSALSEDRIRDAVERVRAATGDRPHEIVGQLLVARGPDPEQALGSYLAGWPADAHGILADGPDAAARVAAAVDRAAALGLTTVLVHPVGDDPDPVGFVEWLGAEVLPRVTA